MPNRAILFPADPEFYGIHGLIYQEQDKAIIDGVVTTIPPQPGGIEIAMNLSTVTAGAPMDSNLFIIVETNSGKFTLDYSGDWPQWVTYSPE